MFPFEKMYLVKERKADMYRLSVYYVCSTLSDMVAHLLYPTCFMCILYFMAGFKRTVECFFLTLSSILLIAVTSQVYYTIHSFLHLFLHSSLSIFFNLLICCEIQGAGELFGAAVMSIKRAGMIASLILMLFLLTGGYYVQVSSTFLTNDTI